MPVTMIRSVEHVPCSEETQTAAGANALNRRFSFTHRPRAPEPPMLGRAAGGGDTTRGAGVGDTTRGAGVGDTTRGAGVTRGGV